MLTANDMTQESNSQIQNMGRSPGKMVQFFQQITDINKKRKGVWNVIG